MVMFYVKIQQLVCMLVEFHQHATILYVIHRNSRHPNAVVVSVDDACTALSIPPLIFSPQLTYGFMSLSLSRVVNIIPFAIQFGHFGAKRASPASPLYPSTVSLYLSASSLMENVEYSAQYHRPSVRWICK